MENTVIAKCEFCNKFWKVDEVKIIEVMIIETKEKRLHQICCFCLRMLDGSGLIDQTEMEE